jgi:membrane associated rhomboid family serine protease
MLENRDYSRHPFPAAGREGPSVLVVLILLNLGALVLRQLFSADTMEPAGALGVKALQEGGWWTVFTHSFIHESWFHLVMNMLLLFAAGRQVLADAGTRHFLYIYLVSGWVAAAVTLLLHPHILMIGASGCVFGVIGAYAALYPERSVTERLGAWAPRLRARNLFVGLLLASVGLEIFAHAAQDWNLPLITNVAHCAHAAGLLTGWLYARHLAPALDAFYHREEFFPQGLRRRRHRDPAESPPVAARSGSSASARRQAHALPDPIFHEAPSPPPPLTNDEFLRQAVDPVLDKLYATGMASLTEAERRILDEAANRFGKQKS